MQELGVSDAVAAAPRPRGPRRLEVEHRRCGWPPAEDGDGGGLRLAVASENGSKEFRLAVSNFTVHDQIVRWVVKNCSFSWR
jgi:hypothetical protein